jgi:hypothetical protein
MTSVINEGNKVTFESYEPSSTEIKPSLSTYGRTFQEGVVQALLVDRKWAEQIMEVFDVDYLELKYLQFLADRYFKYAKKYKDFPTLSLLVSIIRTDLKASSDLVLRDQIIDYLQRMKVNPDPGNLFYIKDRALDFCRKQALKAAMEKSVDLMSTEKYETIVDVIKKAVSIGTASSLGHDFMEDLDSRFITNRRHCIPTGFDRLDGPKIFNGGLGAGDLGTIISSTGGGKSHCLVMLGAHALRLKKNVMHFTFELSETLVGTRYDSNLCDIDSNDVFEKKTDVVDYYKNNRNSLGRLMIKEYPTSTATTLMLRNHMERLLVQKDFRPDIILIDYADIMRSSRQMDSLRHELKLIYEELRGLAGEMGVGIWTASQSNKEGANADVIDTTNMSEGYGKGFVADIVMTISRKPMEKAAGLGRLFLAKNRAGQDGLLFPIKMNTARSKIDILGDNMTFETMKSDEEVDFKKSLKKIWEELKNDSSIKLTAPSRE